MQQGRRREANPKRSLLSHAGFNILFAGSLIGKLADRLYQMALVAAAFVVFAGESSENQLAYIQIVATAPLVVAYSLAGTLIDSADRRRLLYGTMGLKILVVLGLIPLLWGVREGAGAAQLASVRQHWYLALALVFVLGLIDAPFGPAREAAVPDVAPGDHYRLGASLIAASGLISLLLGTLLGGLLAETRHLGPANTVLIAAGCYIFSSAMLFRLPDSVAVPGRRRRATQTVAPGETTLGIKAYFKGLHEGLRYCVKTRGVLELVSFETVFWCVASAFYLLFASYLEYRLHLRPNDKTQAFSLILGTAGIGLSAGAVLIGKLSKRAKAALTYPLSFVLMGLGCWLMLSAPAALSRIPAAQTRLEDGDWVSVQSSTSGTPRLARVVARKGPPAGGDVTVKYVDAGTESAPAVVPRAELTLLLGRVPAHSMAYLCFLGLVVGLGGGLILGRVDADLLTISDERMRGRVFSVKATTFTFALIGTMAPLAQTGDAFKAEMARWFGAALVLAAIPAWLASRPADRAIARGAAGSTAPGSSGTPPQT